MHTTGGWPLRGCATGNAHTPYRANNLDSSPRSPSLPKLSQEAVDTALAKWLHDSAATGRPSIDISEGAFHARIGATREPPMCCDAMWKVYNQSTDTLLSGPTSGYSSALCIRFKLPRP